MSEKRAKENRADAPPKCVYEVVVRTFDNNTVMVTANSDRVLDIPILYTSIVNNMNQAVMNRWMENQKKHNAEKSRIITPGNLH